MEIPTITKWWSTKLVNGQQLIYDENDTIVCSVYDAGVAALIVNAVNHVKFACT
jgi:hypothetical protein